jgi:hypothetical protein
MPGIKDSQGHEWYVSGTEHPFLMGWTCENCGCWTYTQDGLMPAEEPHSNKACIIKDKNEASPNY